MLGDLSLVLYAQIHFHYQGIISKSKVRAVKTLVKSDRLRGEQLTNTATFYFCFYMTIYREVNFEHNANFCPSFPSCVLSSSTMAKSDTHSVSQMK